MASEDFGKDLISVNNLIKKHQVGKYTYICLIEVQPFLSKGDGCYFILLQLIKSPSRGSTPCTFIRPTIHIQLCDF